MAIYNKTNYYSTLGDTVYYTDLGQVFHDLSYGNVVNGVKTFATTVIYTGNAISTQAPVFQSQMVTKRYVDSLQTQDPFYNIYYTGFTKNTVPYTNQVTSLLLNVTTTVPSVTTITQGNILAVMDTPPNNDQVYTFGTSKTGLWIAGGQQSTSGLVANVQNFTMAYSYDGVYWIPLTSSPFTLLCCAVAWNGSIWVAMGAGQNSLAWSYDGFNWNGLGQSLFQINTNATTPPYGAFAWNNFIWVAVCSTSAVGNNFLYSYDGINWIPNASGGLPSAASNWTNVYWNGNLFLATSYGQVSYYNMAYSYNGIQWYYNTTVPLANNITNVGAAAWNGSYWSAAGQINATPYILTSVDGIRWVTNPSGYNFPGLDSNGFFTCVGYNGQIWLAALSGSNTKFLYYSYDGLYWYVNSTYTNNQVFQNVNNLAWNGFMWIASCRYTSGYFSLAYSYNGIQWFGCYNPQTTYNPTSIFSVASFCAAWGGRRENILYFPQNRTLVLGMAPVTGNTIAYAFDGSANWTPSLYNISASQPWNASVTSNFTQRSSLLFSSANGAAWNGYMWVVGGTANPAPYYTVGNVIPSSLNFTTNVTGGTVSYFSNTSTPLFNNVAPSAYTIEAWIRINATGTSQNQNTMGITGNFGANVGIQTVYVSGSYYLSVPNSTVSDNYPLNDNTWHYVAVTVQNGVTNGSYYYIDGIQRPVPFTLTTAVSNTPFLIGTNSTSSTSANFIGWISEIRVWNVALSANQIASQWNASINPASAGLVGYYGNFANLPIGTGTGGPITTGAIIANGVTGASFSTTALTASVTVANSLVNDRATAGAITVGSINVQPSTNFFNYTPAVTLPQHTLAYSHILGGNTVLGNAGNTFIGMGNYTFNIAVNNVQWNGSLWVAVGQSGGFGNTIGYSPDGFTWFGLGNGIFGAWGNSLAWNGTYWVAVGRGANTIAYSPDGIQWTGLGNGIFTVSGNGVAWNGTYWVAVGYSGAQVGGTGIGNTIAISPDGITWTGLGSFTFTTYGNDVASNNTGTMWVAGGQGGNSVAWSLDGTLWNRSQTANNIFTTGTVSTSSVNFPSGWCNSVAWNGRYWIATGYGWANNGMYMNTIAYSSDGNIFIPQTNATIHGPANRVVWNGNQGVGYPLVKTNYTTTPGAGNTFAIWLGGGSLVTPGATNTGNTLAYSYNGQQWFPMGPGGGSTTFTNACTSTNPNGAYWILTGNCYTGNGTSYLGAIGNTLAYTTNTMVTTPLGNSVFYISANTAEWNGVMWVAGGSCASAIAGNTMAYSYNGIQWFGLGNTAFFNSCNYVSWQGTYWVACGQGANTLAYSYNGINWTGLGNYTFYNSSSSAIWNGFMWVATGYSGGAVGTPVGNTLAYSYNGLNWIGIAASVAPISVLATNVAWNGSLWVATGQGGNTLAYSYTGNTWTGVPSSGSIFSYQGNQVYWNGNLWSAAGNCNASSANTNFGNTLAYSLNGINWFGLGGNVFSGTANTVSNANIFGNKIQINSLNQPQLPYRSLDVVGDNYYQAGYNGVTLTIRTTGIGYPAIYSGY
jgi:hypothetical protein